jgi:hypothetical protein
MGSVRGARSCENDRFYWTAFATYVLGSYPNSNMAVFFLHFFLPGTVPRLRLGTRTVFSQIRVPFGGIAQ